jgi:hypothetical protein
MSLLNSPRQEPVPAVAAARTEETNERPASRRILSQTETHDRGAVLAELYRYILSDQWGKHEKLT